MVGSPEMIDDLGIQGCKICKHMLLITASTKCYVLYQQLKHITYKRVNLFCSLTFSKNMNGVSDKAIK